MNHVTNAGYHRILMHIQTSAMWVHNFHSSSLCAAAWNPYLRNLIGMLRGCRQPVA
jgi:hypothetical protein